VNGTDGPVEVSLFGMHVEVLTLVLGNRPLLCLPCDAHHNPA